MKTLVTAERNGYYVVCSKQSTSSSRQYDELTLTGEYLASIITLDRESLQGSIPPRLGEIREVLS